MKFGSYKIDLEIQLFDRNLIKLSLATTADFFEIKHFLKQHKESRANRSDLIYIVRYHTRLIGLARLVQMRDTIESQYWLRGLFIETDFRQRRLATHLLDLMNSDLKSRHNKFEIFAFPYVHLKQFYEENSFHSIRLSDLPLSLQNTYRNALKQGENWLCMRFIHSMNPTQKT
ncbi:GNAT family N-acetyltransferase [Thiomicrorhabdus arctica]|uniref:GNAT family N-acetyltransferase n=1 Tax=Thiomicrorhabdus arctica TaxID=131540 RepID=UPI00037BD3C3|nr:GNAT family N-acetyltransferase [Thiomicrorhabdus arctica]